MSDLELEAALGLDQPAKERCEWCGTPAGIDSRGLVNGHTWRERGCRGAGRPALSPGEKPLRLDPHVWPKKETR